MSVVIETTLGDITVDLFMSERPRACLNFLKLCKIKYYNYNLFHTISRSFIAQTGDPTGSRAGGESIFGVLDGPMKRYFEGENEPRIKHTKMGLVSFVGNEEHMVGSQFFITLGEDLTYLDEKHCVFGEVVEGFEVLEVINEVICDKDDRPYQDVRITHTVILDDPYPDPRRLTVPSRSPSPSAERLQGGRIAPDEEIDETEGRTAEQIAELQADREAKARATILEMVGDLPDADMAPPENVLFVCKLNPVTNDDDLEVIFSRFGKINSCEVIRDKKTGDSLQYAFIEFDDQKACENAYFKMDNVLIDDRRIHVDFSQSVSKVKWHGKGRGVTHYDDKGRKSNKNNMDIGKGHYKSKEDKKDDRSPKRAREAPVSIKNRREGSLSPNRDKNKYKRDRDILSRRYRDRSISPRRERNDFRNKNYSKRDDNREPGRKRERSLTPRRTKSRSKSPQRNQHISELSRKIKDNYRSTPSQRGRERSDSKSHKITSRNSENYVRQHRDKSKSPRKSRDENSRSSSSYSSDRKLHEKNRFQSKSPTPSKSRDKNREAKGARNSDSEDETGKKRIRKKNSSETSSSEDSESTHHAKKNKKKKTRSSTSSDGERGRKKKRNKNKSSKYKSDSDSDEGENKYKKKRNRKNRSDSD